ncbi:Las1-domain-containing protein [Backusella circina FSU 941]|nr:Las1-domain-containing protein [Backusella circina FSU 941]
MLQPRIVPWINYVEYEQVYQLLFSDRKAFPEKVHLALDRIQAWINRGGVPSSVELTSVLIQIILRDEQGPSLTQKELRLMYSAAMIRLVNGLVDPVQGGKFVKSVHVIARNLGLPPWFVDIRHSATHLKLPSLTALRSAAKQAVGWLHDHYWILNLKGPQPERGVDNNNESVNSMDDGLNVNGRLNVYKEARKTFIKSNMSTSQKPYVNAIASLVKVMSEEHVSQVVAALLGIGGLVPAGKKKRASAENMRISDDLIQLWTPLIQGLSVGFPRFGIELITGILDKLTIYNDFKLDQRLINPYSIFENQSPEDDATKAPSYLLTLACWLKYFVQEADNQILENVTLDDILEGCLRRPNYYTRIVLHSISNTDEELATSLKPFIRYIDQMLMKSLNEKRDTQPLSKLDEDILEKELNDLKDQFVNIKSEYFGQQQEQQEDAMDVDSSDTWKLYQDWKRCPIGTLPDGQMPCLDMDVLMRDNKV